MVNYQNGKIFKIVCNETNDTYIGSTCEKKLSRRLGDYKCKFDTFKMKQKESPTNVGNNIVFKILENKNYDIVLIENFACNNSDELKQRQRFFIDTMACINKIKPLRTQKEYRQDKNQKFSKIKNSQK